MQIANDKYLIIDVEATCSDDGVVPRDQMEIIEIGAIVQDARTFEMESEFQSFVRPVRHPELTDFCTKLTGITQDEVSDAAGYADVIERMKAWIYPLGDCLFCSWGDYDRNQFMQDCGFHRVSYPFRSGRMNLKAEFSRAVGLKKRLGIDGALRYLGLEFEGSHHRGLDDAKNIARIVRRVCMGV